MTFWRCVLRLRCVLTTHVAQHDGRDLTARTTAVEVKLHALEKTQAMYVPCSSDGHTLIPAGQRVEGVHHIGLNRRSHASVTR